MDPVDELTRTSGLPAPSREAALAAWESAFATARAAWPQVRFDEVMLVTFVGERLAGSDVVRALAAAPVADLAIAAACAAQEPTAHAAFDGVLTEVDAAGASTRSPRDLVVEVKQLLRVQLLVPKDEKPPGIVGYKGKGPLRGWVRITATRELVRHLKKQSRETSADHELDDALGGDTGDPVLEQLKRDYREEFAAALREAIGDLTAEDRTLLRQQIVDQLSIDEVGVAHGVHRATAARWLNRAREALVQATRERLGQKLKLSKGEIDSVIRLVQSRLDVSVIRFLRES